MKLHKMNNSEKEALDIKVAVGKDFWNVKKVDTNIHHSACFNSKHLSIFMKNKLIAEPNTIVEKDSKT